MTNQNHIGRNYHLKLQQEILLNDININYFALIFIVWN